MVHEGLGKSKTISQYYKTNINNKPMKRNYYYSLVLLALFGMSSPSVAKAADSEGILTSQTTQQAKKVTGTVVDATGEPVIGAAVRVKEMGTGAVTDIDGKFTVEAALGQTLEISFIGYQTITLTVGAQSSYNIVMQDDTQALDEVVVTAMGIKKEKKALGYAVSDINAEELMKNKNTNIVNSLAGKVPGVNITQSGGAAGAGSSIVIRGGNSASESRDNQPLFVVDGIIYDNSTPNTGNSGTDGVTKNNTTFSNRVMDINPEDIETMSVLKGAAAAALYGSRAADGVVIITTKKGAEGSVRVNFSSKFSTSWASKLPEYQKTYGRGYYNEDGSFTDYSMSSWGQKFSESATLNHIYDNVGNFFQNSNVWDNSVSVSGGHKNGSFYLSGSNYDQEGLVPTTGYNKTTFRFNGEQKYGNLTVGANVSYSKAKTDKTLTSGGLYGQGGNGAMTALYGWPLSDDVTHYLNEDGTKYRMFEGLQDLVNDTENPYWILNKNKMQDETERFTAAINASYKLTDWWDVTARVGIDRYQTSAYTYRAPGGAVDERYQQGYLAKSMSNYQYITTNVMSNMNKKFGDFDLNLLLGTTTEATKRVGQTHWGYQFVVPGTISFNNIASGNQFFKDSTSRKRMVGVFGEFRASYKSLAYLTVTGRNDWSSTLPKENRSYFYPSVSGSFVFTELLPQNDFLSFGKVRASWAKVGKDADPYVTNSYLWDVATVYGDKLGIGNNWTGGSLTLKPEIQTSYELGAELRFFKGRLILDYTYYKTKTKNQLCSPRLAQSTGYIFLTLNGGSVINEGMEFMISGKPIQTRDFTWESTLNFSFNNGTLGDFIDGVTTFYPTDAQIGTVKAGAVPNGGDFLGLTGNHWLQDENGMYIVDVATGVYDDANSSTDVIGNREPDLIGGWNNTFTYKNWSFSFLLDLRLGGHIYDGTSYSLVSKGLHKMTENRESVTLKNVVYSDGTAPAGNEITYKAGEMYTLPNGAVRSGEYMIQQYWSSYCSNSYNFMTKTNWLKLRSVSLSYDFSDLLKKQNIIKGLTATVTGTNLFTLTNYKGMDPEVCAAGSGTGGSGSVGLDYCGVPTTSSFSFGVNLTF